MFISCVYALGVFKTFLRRVHKSIGIIVKFLRVYRVVLLSNDQLRLRSKLECTRLPFAAIMEQIINGGELLFLWNTDGAAELEASVNALRALNGVTSVKVENFQQITAGKYKWTACIC